MLARGILGRPWLFQNILDYMENGTVNTEPPVTRRIEILTHHYQMEMNEFGEQQALTQMVKILYGIPAGCLIRHSCVNTYFSAKVLMKSGKFLPGISGSG